jgi:Flp pilus assembly pilin Flp
MRRKTIDLWRDSAGVSAAEYALLLSIFGAMVILSAFGLAIAISGSIENAAKLIASAGSSAGVPGIPEPASGAGNAGNAPGQTGSTPGQSGNTPASGTSPPGQSGSTPGQSGYAGTGNGPKK